MNEANTITYTEPVWRRLYDPLRVFGHDLPPQVWVALLAVVLLAAFFYVGWMYVKDSRGVGPWWAIFLGLLRSAVYVILALVFMLPAWQVWVENTSQSQVVLLFDGSRSMVEISDDITGARPGAKPETRQEKVLRFLTDNKFLAGIDPKAPVRAYRFGRALDEGYLYFANGRAWTRDEWEKKGGDKKEGEQAPAAAEPTPLPPEYWSAWLMPSLKAQAAEEWADREKARLEALAAVNEKLKQAEVFRGTNVGDSVLAAVNRELNNRVQGIVIFTDGRSTEGSPQAFAELAQRAEMAQIPIFVVAVGDDRPQVRIDIADLRVPQSVQPEDKFRAVVEVTGEGLPDQAVPVELEVTHVKKGQGDKEELLPLVLVESQDKDASAAEKRAEVVLGTKVTLRPPAAPKFDRSTPPRVTVEFPIDAAALAEAAGKGKELTEGDNANKKWVLGETREGELRFRARVPRNKLEVAARKETADARMTVLKRPLRVLLFASSATRDYQFLRSLLMREMEKKRVELAIHLQLPPGRTEWKTGVVQDVDAERLLTSFPNRFDTREGKGGDDKSDFYNLAEYDVIVGFDPDWTRLTDKQVNLVKRWVEKGGGLIVEGGPVNTVQVVRPPVVHQNKLKPIQDLYPVVLEDIRIDAEDRDSSVPWPLNFNEATPDMEFLKLAEDEDAPFLADWMEFFYGTTRDQVNKTVERGFYNYYPVRAAKAGAQVVARFTDPKARLKDNTQQPYIVMSTGRDRVIWIGSGETWRLRQLPDKGESYHERFWTKLIRYAGARSQNKAHSRIRLEMRDHYRANRPIDTEVKIDASNGEPLGPDAKPVLNLKVPESVAGDPGPTTIPLRPKPGGEGWFAARFQLRSAGKYDLEVKVPETGDSYRRAFTVEEADPEIENTRPDFDRLYRLASEAGPVLARMSESERAELKKHLQRPALDAKDDLKDDKPRLYFDLKTAHLIPSCMIKEEKVQRSRGPVTDRWDDGFVLRPGGPSRQPIKVSYVLLAVVGLLSLEWLTRKLLRLA